MDGDFDRARFKRAFSLPLPDTWPGAVAVAPPMPYSIVRLPRGGRVASILARWGLVPVLHRGLLRQFKASTFNARSEDVRDRPTFALAYREARRCLVLVNGFYEWSYEKGEGVPHRATRADGRPLVLDGLWETWTGEFGPMETFTLLTRGATGSLATLHDRLPVVLERNQCRAWLDPRTSEGHVRALVQPGGVERLTMLLATDVETRPRHKRRGTSPEPERIVLFGTSAGARLGGVLLTTPDDAACDGEGHEDGQRPLGPHLGRVRVDEAESRPRRVGEGEGLVGVDGVDDTCRARRWARAVRGRRGRGPGLT
ncbi:SOS response-associated peptidase [Deinococcus pimensis]|uniref:SOS response-associated peptidase n=1 Tax=Deinococcus pimensis TaxID=309888 RepID=UPI0004B1CFD4|nr:SOS response-associated peptidase [Deinococcus pimensis]